MYATNDALHRIFVRAKKVGELHGNGCNLLNKLLRRGKGKASKQSTGNIIDPPNTNRLYYMFCFSRVLIVEALACNSLSTTIDLVARRR